jgi:hypothetical protein
MPALALVLGLHLLCAAHVVGTGRPWQWLLILLAPLVGSLAYVVLEILPDLGRSPVVRGALLDLGAALDPERELRVLAERALRADTVANRSALAEECLRLGRATDAKGLFASCLTGVHGSDPALMLGLARAQFALAEHAAACATLDRLRAAHPGLVCPEGHLVYARAKEQQGAVEQALIEYAALAEYHPGEEARCRFALLLQRTGRVAEAKALFAQVIVSVEEASGFYHRAQRGWYELARRHLVG